MIHLLRCFTRITLKILLHKQTETYTVKIDKFKHSKQIYMICKNDFVSHIQYASAKSNVAINTDISKDHLQSSILKYNYNNKSNRCFIKKYDASMELIFRRFDITLF